MRCATIGLVLSLFFYVASFFLPAHSCQLCACTGALQKLLTRMGPTALGSSGGGQSTEVEPTARAKPSLGGCNDETWCRDHPLCTSVLYKSICSIRLGPGLGKIWNKRDWKKSHANEWGQMHFKNGFWMVFESLICEKKIWYLYLIIYNII